MSDIIITDSAREQIKLLMSEEGLSDEYYLRVSVKGGGCSGLSYDLDFTNEVDENAGDNIFNDNDTKLVVNVKSLMYLLGTTLDYSSGLNGKGFEFNNPNASRTCGCGESFSV
jgi:iron-sulfur cluster assembly protein